MRRQAARWLARLQSGREPDVERKFARWYDEDPAHRSAFDRVAKSYEKSGLLRESLVHRSSPEAIEAPRSSRPAYAIAAAIALALLAATLVSVFGQRLVATSTDAVMLSTRDGEIRSFTLSDGSTVTLDSATTLELHLSGSQRSAVLRRGRARFAVKAAKLPFVIEAGGAIARTRNGLLDAEHSSEQSGFDLLSGGAEVHAPSAAPQSFRPLAPGSAVRTIDGQLSEIPIPASSLDWTREMLEFDGTPLPAAADRANLYSDEKIVVEPGLEDLKVSGAFRAGDTQGLAKALARTFHLSLVETQDKRLLLRRTR